MDCIGEKIFRLRKRDGISQEVLADRLNVSRQTISKWESDSTQPNSENIKALCELFSVSIDYFYDNLPAKNVIAASEIAVTDAAENKKGIKLYVFLLVITTLIIVVLGFLSFWFGCIAFTPNVGDEMFNHTILFRKAFLGVIIALTILLVIEILLIIVIFKRCKHNANKM